jgi:hypothetical protein
MLSENFSYFIRIDSFPLMKLLLVPLVDERSSFQLENSTIMERNFQTVKPFLFVLELYGLFPANSYGITKKNFQTFIAPTMSMCLLFLIMFLNLKLFENVDSNSEIIRSSYHVSLAIGLVSICVMMVHQWIKARQISNILKLSDEFDAKVS